MNQLQTSAPEGNADRAFVDLHIERALKHMEHAFQIITDTQKIGEKTRTVTGPTSPAVETALKVAADAVRNQTSLLRQELRDYRDELEWERLCVVMYGPTNSGKSTILESLSCGNGESIGTGHKDHTRESRKIRYGPLLLVDTPGIEGSEGELRRRTQTAVRQAHVVAVVTGTGKEPERGGLDKLAEDAQRAGEVLSLLNVRARPTAYRRRSSLGTHSTPELEDRIRQSMRRVFNGRHTEHLNLNAYLAFIAGPGGASRFPSEQHQRDRDRATDIFGSLDAAAAFSGIGRLTVKLDELIREARPRILWGNGFKAVMALGDVSAAFLGASSSLDKAVKLWNRAVRDAEAESEAVLQRSRARADQIVSSWLARLSNKMKATFRGELDRRSSKIVLEHALQRDIRAVYDRL